MNSWVNANLKQMTASDLQKVLYWRNQDFVRKMMYHSEIITMKEHLDWFNKVQSNNTSIAQIFYFENKPYGVVNIHQIDCLNGTCGWSFYIGEKDAPSGLGTLLGYLAIDYIFNSLNLRKLCAEVIKFNDKSYNFHKKLGFEQEECLKDHIKKEGEYIDIYLFGLSKSTWLEQSNQIKEKIKIKFQESE